MKLSKYFLSAFAFVVALGGAVGSAFDANDFYVSTGGVIKAIQTLGNSCLTINNGMTCAVLTSDGTRVPTWDTPGEIGVPGKEQRLP